MRVKMNARERILQIIATSMTSDLLEAGFTRAGIDFYRRQGEVVQLVQVQLSASNFFNHGHFSINVALNFNRVCQLEHKAVVEQPKEYLCQFRRRLETLIAGAPPRWEVGDGLEQPEMAVQLRAACRQLIALLNGIDSLERFLALGWLQAGADLGLRAQIHYLLGDTQAAIRDLQDPFFHARPNWDFDTWLAQRGLTGIMTVSNE
jgi:hypothetical protein